eukprot:CAMPEP_0197516380 /NCGR_PEP_ID=MMETSP1318-20131121/1277_1 /TAXON_ID=552666 /ORGANISM="Partenskyella glossopodia, Strain RCC365" /LENGTH=382 /DNA_ID=CAMNT_0043065097 /DNA_START=152 /DNA_END=1300 /DNA_ORIENTATION=-
MTRYSHAAGRVNIRGEATGHGKDDTYPYHVPTPKRYLRRDVFKHLATAILLAAAIGEGGGASGAEGRSPKPSQISQSGILEPEMALSERSSVVEIPMYPCEGSYCVEYGVEGGRFRGVLDTGSPFLILDGTACTSRWGCYKGEGAKSGLEDTFERYASQEGDVEWKQGLLNFGGSSFRDLVFGVFKQVEGKGGEGAALIGLVKDARQGIRPTLLQQTNIKSLRFDFPGQRFSISNRPLVPRSADAVPIVDTRKMGAPVRHYVVRVGNLNVNGRTVSSSKPIYAMIDSGTTGMYISDGLFYPVLRDFRGFRECEVDLLTEKGNSKTLKASRPDPQFLVFPVNFPWLDESKAHLIVLGLAFMDRYEVTFDVDEGRIDFADLPKL